MATAPFVIIEKTTFGQQKSSTPGDGLFLKKSRINGLLKIKAKADIKTLWYLAADNWA